MAALTTPIVRGDMRLYPGMPVKRINVRARAANRLQKVKDGQASPEVEGSPRRPRERTESSLSSASAHSAFDVSTASPAASAAALARPSPLSISQQYLCQRREHGHKPMTEEQRRKRAISLRQNTIPEETEEAKARASSSASAGAKPRCSFRKGSNARSSIRRFFKKLGLGSKEDTPPQGLGADDGSKTWRNPSNEHLAQNPLPPDSS